MRRASVPLVIASIHRANWPFLKIRITLEALDRGIDRLHRLEAEGGLDQAPQRAVAPPAGC